MFEDEHAQRATKWFAPQMDYEGDAAIIDAPLLLMAFTNRCGSNLFAEYLRSTGKIAGLHEQLNAGSIDIFAERFGSRSFPSYIQSHWETAAPGQIFGMKASWSQILFLKKHKIDRMFRHGMQIIHVERYDVLAQAVSLSIASQTNQWTSWQKTSGREPVYNPAEITSFLAYIGNGNAKIREISSLLGVRYTYASYEGLTAAPQAIANRVLQWLGLPKTEISLETTHKKQATDLNKRFIERYREEFANDLLA